MPQAEPYAGTVRIVGIRRPADVLARRIEARARAMFGGGLLDETRALLAAGHDTGQPALSGHGYAEAAGVLAGTTSVDEAVASTSRRVRQYARRQMTWFDRDARIEWLDAGDAPSDRPALVEAALAHLTG